MLRKNIYTIIAIIVLSSNAFSISVGDNDGSAFITKAEFDALKSSFQSTIDTYNQGIDSKIDLAIASYLAGISIGEKPIDYSERINVTAGGTAWFRNTVPFAGTSTVVSNVNVNSTRHVTFKDVEPQYIGYLWHGWSTVDDIFIDKFQTKLGDAQYGSNMISWNVDLTTKLAGWTGTYTWYGMEGSTYWVKDTSGGRVDGDPMGKWNQIYSNYQASSDSNSSGGSGERWIFKEDLNGNRYLLKYDTIVYPNIDMTVWIHKYLDVRTSATAWKNAHLKDGGLSVNDSLSIDTTGVVRDFGKSVYGTKKGDDETTDANYYDGMVSKVEVDDGVEYESMNWGTNANYSIYANGDSENLIINGTDTITVPVSTFYDIYYTQYGKRKQTNTQSAYTIKYNKLSYANNSYNLKSFIYNPATLVFGENVYIGEGIPIFITAKISDDLKFKIKFVTNDGAHKNIHYSISDKKFSNCNPDPSANTVSGTAVAGDEKEITITKPKEKQVYWINIYNADLGYLAGIDEVIY